MDYKAIINKVIIAMISANTRQWTSNSMRDLCRMIAPQITDNQLYFLMTKIRQDSRIKTTRVTPKKVYFSYRGLVE